jgi:ribosome maturation factor RimP
MDVESLVRPVVEGAGLELVEVSFQRGPGRGLLRVTVDRDGGVDLDSIGGISERISRRLDLEGFDPGPYTLEVSSPGVERPLRRPDEFARRVGEKVKVRTTQTLEGGTRTFTGTILEAGQDGVRIATEAGERTVPFDDIESARTVFEWGPRPQAKQKAKGGRR